MTGSQDVDAYAAALPAESAVLLGLIRARVRHLVPDARESISYAIPSFSSSGRPFLHVGVWAQHVAIYPVPAGDEAFQELVAPYRSGRSTLRFELRDPFPFVTFDAIVTTARAERG